MSGIVSLARGKLTDPILLGWALHRYQDAVRCQSALRKSMEEQWFDELSLRRWLDLDDDEILKALLTRLPAERFAPLVEVIAGRWDHWHGRLAHEGAMVLAHHRPDLAASCFAARLERDLSDYDVVLGIVRALPQLARDSARTLAQRLVKRLLDGQQIDAASRDLALAELISVLLELERAQAMDLARDRLAHAGSVGILQEILSAVSRKLLAQPVWVSHAADIRNGETALRFAALAPFFRPGAPLAELDRHCEGSIKLDALVELAEQWLDGEDCASVVAAMTPVFQAPGTAAGYRERHASFLIGAVASACARQALDTDVLDLASTVGWLGVDLSDHPHDSSLVARLAAFDRASVVAALSEALVTARPHYGACHLAAAMGALGWGELAPALVSALDEDSADLLCEAAQEALVQIGCAAQAHLIAEWAGLDESQRIYGLTVIEQIGGEAAAEFALAREEELLDEDQERWCQLAMAAPDKRLLARLEPHLKRQQGLIDETFYCLARLLDVAHPERESAGERVRARRAQQRARLAAIERGDWSQDSLSLALRCPVCGGANRYEVRRILVDPGARASWVLAEEHACLSCGQFTDLEPTTEAQLAVMGELLRLTATSDAGLAGRSQVLVRAKLPFEGCSTPVGEIVTRCRESVTKEPERVAAWLRLGLCYHQVLNRPRAGLAFVDRALRLEPMAIEGVLQRADALAFLGQPSAALELLEQALARKERWRFFLADLATPAQVGAKIASLYNHLLDRLGRLDQPRLHGAFLAAPKKVGRNDPCPCGSGRKFKKCCLASA